MNFYLQKSTVRYFIFFLPYFLFLGTLLQAYGREFILFACFGLRLFLDEKDLSLQNYQNFLKICPFVFNSDSDTKAHFCRVLSYFSKDSEAASDRIPATFRRVTGGTVS